MTVDHPAGRSSARKQVCPCLPLPSSFFQKVGSKHSINVQIREFNRKIKDEIISQIPSLQLITSIPRRSSSFALDPMPARTTHSALVHSDIVGSKIQEDARRLIESLLTVQETDQNQLLVYAIVGIGGIGKTTLAKLVFHDNRIKNCFYAKGWVSVTQNYSPANILRSILSSVEGYYHDTEHYNLGFLRQKMKSIAQGKRLFIVLDDVWESDRIWYELLRSLLLGNTAMGSRVLVTTRDMAVAKQMMAFYSHQMQPLLPDDGWLLLCKSAFPFWEQKDAINDKWNLRDVGMEFVKKCDCLPMAINAIGGILLGESKTREAWEIVLRSSLWKVNGLPPTIHAALYMSYQYLPANIRQCFLFCSLFPADEHFSKSLVLEYWMQEGVIQKETNLTAYEVGERYLKLLAERNLLMHHPNEAGDSKFKMHDLLRSLSHFLMQNDTLVLNDQEMLSWSSSGEQMKLRRLSLMEGSCKMTTTKKTTTTATATTITTTMTTTTFYSLPKNIQEQASLRTLLVFDEFIGKIDDDLFNHLRFLRILSISGTCVTELPASIGALTHLRYLNLSYTLVKELPQTIENLKSLKTLIINRCRNLTALPSCIMKLRHLCHLSIYHAGLNRLPPGLGGLNKLLYLYFIMPPEDAANESSTINELAALNQLRELCLDKLERVSDKSQAKCAALRDKICLKDLYLECSESSSSIVEVANRNEEVFEELCPPPQLQTLEIYRYHGHNLPSWLGRAPSNHLLGQLLKLTISRCSNCKQLDGLGLLSNLEVLVIKHAPTIKSIGAELFSNNNNKGNVTEMGESVFLPKLKLLNIVDMGSWEEWSCLGKSVPVMPHLEILKIYGCPELKSFPEELLYHAAESLKRITILRANKLVLKVVQNLPSLEALRIECIPNLERISGLPALQVLHITECPGLELVELEHTLQIITWMDFKAESLPGWIFSADGSTENYGSLKATSLEIHCNEQLASTIAVQAAKRIIDSKRFESFFVYNLYGFLRVSYIETIDDLK